MPPLLEQLRERLDTSIHRIRACSNAQHAALLARNQSVEKRRQLLRRDRMIPITRMAKPLLKFAPGTASALRVPHARADAKTVADSAIRLAEVLKPHQKLLIAAGCDPTFLADLRRDGRTLASTARESEKARVEASRLTAQLAAEFKNAKKTVMAIEGILMLHRKSLSNFGAWRTLRRVSRRLGRPKKRKSHPAPAVA